MTPGWLLTAELTHLAGACAAATLAVWVAGRRALIGPAGNALVAALVLSAVWALCVAASGVDSAAAHIAESGRNLAWLFVIYRLFSGDGRHMLVRPIRPVMVSLAAIELFHTLLMTIALAGEFPVTARETLFQSQKMDAIGQLTGGVAHDFNNLLMATLSSLELLRKRLLGHPASLRLLDNAVEGAKRGATLTQRMLAFARRQDLTLARVDIPLLVRGMSDLIERSLGPSIFIDTRFPLRLDMVTADTNQLEMALLNLVVNARDAMPDGGAITISAQQHTVGANDALGLTPGNYVALRITDTGVGMDAETLARAAEPFFTTKGVGKGTGLGLSMAHGLAEQSGGRLVLESALGEGASATLWLPVLEQPVDIPSPCAAPEAPASARRLTVLAVDDDALVLMNTVALLEDLGHVVFEAYSGDDALVIFRREPHIDLIITDQAMPGMTGVQLAEAAQAERGEVPIILATGYGELPPGANPAFRKLGKPFSQADLFRAIAVACPETQ